jgi:hypothetical protein
MVAWANNQLMFGGRGIFVVRLQRGGRGSPVSLGPFLSGRLEPFADKLELQPSCQPPGLLAGSGWKIPKTAPGPKLIDV